MLLYIDIIQIFLYILRFLGSKDWIDLSNNFIFKTLTIINQLWSEALKSSELFQGSSASIEFSLLRKLHLKMEEKKDKHFLKYQNNKHLINLSWNGLNRIILHYRPYKLSIICSIQSIPGRIWRYFCFRQRNPG